MVQELQIQESVPEELYNLTQLAEVTMIAGKLSTTDINEIKNYININKSHQQNNEFYGPYSYYQVHDNLYPETDSLLGSHPMPQCHNEKQSYESTKKKWKNNWENHRQTDDSLVPSSTSNFLIRGSFESNNQSISSTSTSPALSYMLLSSSSSSSVSSDDDSTRSLLSYSHKVFDRKKQRTFKQTSSTDSDVDFVRNENSIYSNNNEKNFCDNDFMELNQMDRDNNNIYNNYNNSINENNSESSSDGKNDVHVCPECGKKYSTSSNLARHRQTHRFVLNYKQYLLSKLNV